MSLISNAFFQQVAHYSTPKSTSGFHGKRKREIARKDSVAAAHSFARPDWPGRIGTSRWWRGGARRPKVHGGSELLAYVTAWPPYPLPWIMSSYAASALWRAGGRAMPSRRSTASMSFGRDAIAGGWEESRRKSASGMKPKPGLPSAWFMRAFD